MTDIIKLTGVLTGISIIAALLIAVTFSKTKETIAVQQRAAQENALATVLPSGAVIDEHRGTCENCPDTFWTAISGDDTSYAFKIANRGYSSTISYLIGVKPDGTILGLSVLDQNETPGLGTRVTEVVSKDYLWNGLFKKKDDSDPWFSEQFQGINILKPLEISKAQEWHKADNQTRNQLRSSNSITALTGATISTRAITSGLEKTAASYLKALRGI